MSSGNGIFGQSIRGPMDEATRRVDERLGQLFLALGQLQETFIDVMEGIAAEDASDTNALVVLKGKGTGGNNIVGFDFGIPQQGTAWLVRNICATGEGGLYAAWLALDAPKLDNPQPIDGIGAIWQSAPGNSIGGSDMATELYIPSGRHLTGYVSTNTADGQASLALSYKRLTEVPAETANTG